MHDPMTVAFTIRRPWPKREKRPTPTRRWQAGWPFFVAAGRSYYWPLAVTVWHREPDGQDSGAVCRGRWQAHVHHWRIQIHALQRVQRRLFQRCAWCGGASTKAAPVNVSHTWDSGKVSWWVSRPGVFHHDCSSVEHARNVCMCQPLAPRYRRCPHCDRHPGRPEAVEALRILRTVHPGQRPSARQMERVRAIYARGHGASTVTRVAASGINANGAADQLGAVE